MRHPRRVRNIALGFFIFGLIATPGRFLIPDGSIPTAWHTALLIAGLMSLLFGGVMALQQHLEARARLRLDPPRPADQQEQPADTAAAETKPFGEIIDHVRAVVPSRRIHIHESHASGKGTGRINMLSKKSEPEARPAFWGTQGPTRQ